MLNKTLSRAINKVFKTISASNNRLLRRVSLFCFKIIAKSLGALKVENWIVFNEVSIRAPFNHTVSVWSTYIPEMNWNLGRIAALTSAKYPSGSIIDVGANIGDTWAILRGSNVKNRIILIEGDKSALKFLRTNVANDSCAKIIENFVGPKNDSLQFIGLSGATSGMLVRSEMSNEGHQTATLDSLVSEEVRLIKVDTDGLDTLVVRTGAQLLKTYHPILFMEFQPYHLLRNDNPIDFIKWIIQLGYISAILWDNSGKFIGVIDLSEIGLIKSLLAYFHGAPNCQFLDIAFCHCSDSELRDTIVAKEGEISRMQYLKITGEDLLKTESLFAR
jgi:FkbM family methyltransferase